jgi:hypothetical protein
VEVAKFKLEEGTLITRNVFTVLKNDNAKLRQLAMLLEDYDSLMNNWRNGRFFDFDRLNLVLGGEKDSDSDLRGLKGSRTKIMNTIVSKFKSKEWIDEKVFRHLEVEKEMKRVVDIDNVEGGEQQAKKPRKKVRR